MSDPLQAPLVDAATVATLLELAGLPPPDPATVARIVVGANLARGAVASGGTPGFDAAPDAFVAELERLAADGA